VNAMLYKKGASPHSSDCHMVGISPRSLNGFTLYKKAYRAMWAHKRAYLACIFLIMVGTMLLTAMGTALSGLKNAMDSFYEQYKLADVWASVGALPLSEAHRLLAIQGVADITARTRLEVRASVNDSDEIIILRLFSYVPNDTERINNFLISQDDFKASGRYSHQEGSKVLSQTTPHADQETVGEMGLSPILLNEAFISAHSLNPNDQITLFAQGRELRYTVAGSIMTPEYVYIARGGTEVMPNASGFGIAYITQESMDILTGNAGIANEVVFTLQDGVELEDIYGHLQDALSPYGLISLSDRMGLISYSFLDMEVKSIEAVSTSMPMVFVSMAMVVLYLMLKRIIEQERTQIGVLKAFGYANKDLLLHYMAYGGITGIIGGLLGFLYGGALSGFYLRMFLEFFAMPDMKQSVEPIYLAASLGLAVGGGLLGAFMGAFKALTLAPSEAMRPESPKPIKYDIIGKIKFLPYILSSRGQMALRGIVRNPFRSGFVIIGVTFSFVLLVVFGDMEGMVDTLLYSQFTDMQKYSAKATLRQPIPLTQAIEAAYAIPQITQAEALWEVPVVLSNRHIKSGATITGIAADSGLFAVFDTDTRRAYPPPTDGLIITNGLADQLHAQAGTLLYISNLQGEDIAVPVTRVITQNVGSGAYMEISALADLLEHPAAANALIFNTSDLPAVADYLKESTIVGTVDSVEATLQQYVDMLAPFSAIYSVMFFMGVAIAFAIIYNTAAISLSERQREFATLRVLGLSVDEVCEIMRFEYWVLAAVGIAVGLPLAPMLLVLINAVMDTSMMSMPTNINTSAYIMAGLGCIAAIMLSNFSTKRKIRKFNMVEVLKERE